MTDLFDAAASEAGKVDGMASAAESRVDILDVARKLARGIALTRPDRTCTADDVARALVAEGFSVYALGNAAGSLFKGDEWTWSGRFVQSERRHAHRNLLRVWILT